MIDKTKLLQILTKYLAAKETKAERKELLEWYEQQESNHPDSSMEDDVRIKTRARLITSIKSSERNKSRIPLIWLPIAAALLVVGIFGYQYFLSGSEKKATMEMLSQIKPAKDHAIMILENGREINLDQLAANEEIQIDGMIIKKDKDGKVSYHLASSNLPVIPKNTIQVPIGSTFSLTLTDGSRVVLNSDSKLTFPSNFSTGDRVVELEGEGYFEVKHLDDNSRFIVKTDDQNVEVLGTKFNIKAYKTEENTLTSLEDGSVKVTIPKGKSALLKPNQQARTDGSTELQVGNVNIDNILGWTKGQFCFDGSNTVEVLREIARWYDIDINYKKAANSPNQYVGKIPRNLTLNKLVELLNYADLKSTATITNNQRIKLQIY
ncbi:hypothetical protein CHU00_01835 [Sphingobacterium cellulitidis]|uniref:FecR family protein n=1 Tax=Sphingobacterium cellulitidis TaxID=1768011 RepID=UPI000B94273C|nr:FecR family protein [Sphingobacterium cellulitidis]OYD47635.1 hypothetical protein CHU00_01835 [Sphingobacterium cellulitidis]